MTSTPPGDLMPASCKTQMVAIPELAKSPTIVVAVGASLQEFHLHCSALKAISPYFAGLLSSQMSEVTKGRVELTTEVDDEEAFTMFIQYLYYGDYQVDKLAKQDHDDSCASGSSTETTTTGNNKQSSNAHLLLHAKVYVLAERLCVISLKELSCIKLTEGLCWVLLDKRMADCPLESFCAIINTIYAHTTLTRSAKKVRELLADFASRRLSVERRRPNFLDCVARYPDFAVDLVRMAGDHRPSKKK